MLRAGGYAGAGAARLIGDGEAGFGRLEVMLDCRLSHWMDIETKCG